MSIEELVDALKHQATEIMKGAKALSDRLEEKRKAGGLKPDEEKEWLKAIQANVKKAQELRADVQALLKLR